MNIADAVGSIRAAADTLRAADKIPEYEKLIDALGRVAQLQADLAQAQADHRTCRDELAAIHLDSATIANLRRDGEFLRSSNPREIYCAACAISDQRLGVVINSTNPKTGGSMTQCARCKQVFHRAVR